ncbi:hypothetical protein OIDMADRAFT_73037, partial [Oidiodendron maius Zn]
LDAKIDRLLAAVVDGRTTNVRYRQNELHRLYAGLKVEKEAVCDAIMRSSAVSTSEALQEYSLALDSIRQSYETLDFENSMKEEYLVATGRNNLFRRVGLGLIAIRAQEHSRVYSVIGPLAAAIAAGNCVLWEMGSALSPITTILSRILADSLDQDAFYATPGRITEAQESQVNLLVDQTCSSLNKVPSLSSMTELRSIVVVDRTTDVRLASKAIVGACLFSNGTSPYAPRIVLVNEFLCQSLIATCIEDAKSLKEMTNSNQKLELVKHDGSASSLTTQRINGQRIVILPTTSLVSCVSSLCSKEAYLATYIFADAKTAKFIGEQVTSSVTYINQIPTWLLFGPPSPTMHPHHLHPRYTPDMFSQPRTLIIEPVDEISLSIQDLKPTGQKPGHAVGFFEQGILLG